MGNAREQVIESEGEGFGGLLVKMQRFFKKEDMRKIVARAFYRKLWVNSCRECWDFRDLKKIS